jgi:MFS family permease
MNDRRPIYAAAFLRALATGMAGVLLGPTLARLGFSAAAIGAVLSAGLAGATLALVIVTWAGDRLGRRRCLMWLSLLGAVGGLGAALVSSPVAMAAAAFVGILNGMGRDRGAALVLEQAILPATTDDAGRTGAFARYNLLTDIGHALGALLAAAPTLLAALGVDKTQAFRAMFLLYAALLAAGAPLALALSPAAETGAEGPRRPVSPQSKKIIWKISALFAIDSIAGGFLGSALLSYFFFERFAVSAALIGGLFFAARVLNALSHLGATSRRACCSPRWPSRRTSGWRRSSSCCARAWWRWTCRRGSPM